MNTYSIQQVSELLQMSKDTLRYYDKLGLVCPKRSENRYRYYTKQDIIYLQYAEVMKFSGFTLAEIGQIFQYKRARDINNFPELVRILNKKKLELIRKQKLFRSMLEFISEAETVIAQKKDPTDISKIDTLVKEIFEELRSKDNEE